MSSESRASAASLAVTREGLTPLTLPGRPNWLLAKLKAGVVMVGPPAVVLVAAVLFWHFYVTLRDTPSWLFPAPLDVLDRFRNDYSSLWEAFRATATEALMGYALATVVGFAIAILFSQSKVVQRSLYPFVILLQTTPIIAIAPLILIAAGPGRNSIVIVTFIVTVFPIVANSTIGLMSADHNLINLFKINNASRLQELWKLRIPFAMPYVVTGLKISAGLSVIGAIVGEFFAGKGGSSSGLGSLITFSAARLQTDMLFAAALCSSALGILMFVIVTNLGNYLVRNWHESAVTHEN